MKRTDIIFIVMLMVIAVGVLLPNDTKQEETDLTPKDQLNDLNESLNYQMQMNEVLLNRFEDCSYKVKGMQQLENMILEVHNANEFKITEDYTTDYVCRHYAQDFINKYSGEVVYSSQKDNNKEFHAWVQLTINIDPSNNEVWINESKYNKPKDIVKSLDLCLNNLKECRGD